MAQVYVEAVVRVADGSFTLHAETSPAFWPRRRCDSAVLIDGDEAEDLSSIGLSLADPPVSAPVLLQHILRHALSTEPKQRVAYFKSLLSLSDLDLLERVAEGPKRLEQEPDGHWLQQIATLPEELVDLQNGSALSHGQRNHPAISTPSSAMLCEMQPRSSPAIRTRHSLTPR